MCACMRACVRACACADRAQTGSEFASAKVGECGDQRSVGVCEEVSATTARDK